MVNLLAKLLSPIFGPMGVSEADLLTYIGMVQNYVWVILIALAVMIVVLIAASGAKKGTKGAEEQRRRLPQRLQGGAERRDGPEEQGRHQEER